MSLEEKIKAFDDFKMPSSILQKVEDGDIAISESILTLPSNCTGMSGKKFLALVAIIT